MPRTILCLLSTLLNGNYSGPETERFYNWGIRRAVQLLPRIRTQASGCGTVRKWLTGSSVLALSWTAVLTRVRPPWRALTRTGGVFSQRSNRLRMKSASKWGPSTPMRIVRRKLRANLQSKSKFCQSRRRVWYQSFSSQASTKVEKIIFLIPSLRLSTTR